MEWINAMQFPNLVWATGRLAPETAVGAIEIQLYPRKQTQFGNRSRSESAMKRVQRFDRFRNELTISAAAS
jgi:hypothetical protein